MFTLKPTAIEENFEIELPMPLAVVNGPERTYQFRDAGATIGWMVSCKAVLDLRRGDQIALELGTKDLITRMALEAHVVADNEGKPVSAELHQELGYSQGAFVYLEDIQDEVQREILEAGLRARALALLHQLNN